MAAPVLSSVSPSQGPSSGGTTVTLTGTGFTGATAVKFGTSAATSFTVVGSTQIVAVTPPGTGAVNVTVTTSGGTSNSLTYTYLPPPSVAARETESVTDRSHCSTKRPAADNSHFPGGRAACALCA